MKRLDTDEKKEEMVRFLLERFNDRERIKPDSYLCLSCKHYKPRKGECKKIKGFLGEDFAHGNVYSAICPEYEPEKEWQWLKGKKQWFGEDILGGHEPDDFCSKIERRENDENN